MSYELKDGQGSLFINDKKKQDNHPDRTGKFLLNGQMYKIAGWMKKKPNGEPYLSLKVEAVVATQPVQQRTAVGNSYAAAKGDYGSTASLDDLNDEIPF